MKPAEIRAMSDEQLSRQVNELLAEWRNLRFQQAVGQLTATARIRQIRYRAFEKLRESPDGEALAGFWA